MSNIRKILNEEISDPFAGVPNELLYDFLQEFGDVYDEGKAKQFCKYLSIDVWAENMFFFDELIDLNKLSEIKSPNDIIRPKKKEYKVVFEIKEKLWVKYDTQVTAFGYNINSINEQIWNGDIGGFDGREVPNSRTVFDSEFLDENSYIEEI